MPVLSNKAHATIETETNKLVVCFSLAQSHLGSTHMEHLPFQEVVSGVEQRIAVCLRESVCACVRVCVCACVRACVCVRKVVSDEERSIVCVCRVVSEEEQRIVVCLNIILEVVYASLPLHTNCVGQLIAVCFSLVLVAAKGD